MRKWGPVVAVLFLIGFIGNLVSPADDEPNSTATSQVEQSATSEPAPSPTNSADPSESVEPAETETTAEPQSTESGTAAAEEATETPESSASPVTQETEVETDEFSQLLLALTIEPEVTSGYDRDLFRHWIDADGDGCNARREVLIAEAIEAPVIGDRCELIGGLWYSAFDGVFTDDDSSFDVDHMVPLKEAWDSGANEWSSERRRAFANDLDLPASLIAVSASSNRSKSDRDPADWLPPLASYHCQYVEDWVRIKVKWELSVDQSEFAAIRSVLAGC